MIKSMRSWNDLEAGVVVEGAEVAVVVDGDADHRVRVLAEPVVHGEESARPGSFESCGGSTRGTDGTTSGRGRRCATGARTGSARPRGSARARERACAPSAGNGSREPLQAHGSVLGWAHNLMVRYTGCLV